MTITYYYKFFERNNTLTDSLGCHINSRLTTYIIASTLQESIRHNHHNDKFISLTLMPDSTELSTFQVFSDKEQADIIIEQLKAAGIPVQQTKIKPFLDKIIVGEASQQQISIAIPGELFPRAHEVLIKFYEDQLEQINPDYFLFHFSDLELKDVLSKPDEWGYFNVALAKKILNEKYETDVIDTIDFASDRKEVLSKPDSATTLLVIGYLLFAACLIVAGLTPYAIYSFQVFVFPFICGIYVWQNKRALPDGSKSFVFRQTDVRMGRVLALLSGTLILLLVAIVLIHSRP